ncbi:hypothetical protein GCM10009424_20970 [Sphingomonas ursincola]
MYAALHQIRLAAPTGDKLAIGRVSPQEFLGEIGKVMAAKSIRFRVLPWLIAKRHGVIVGPGRLCRKYPVGQHAYTQMGTMGAIDALA